MSLFLLLIFVVVVLHLIFGSSISRSSKLIEKSEKPFIFRQHQAFLIATLIVCLFILTHIARGLVACPW